MDAIKALPGNVICFCQLPGIVLLTQWSVNDYDVYGKQFSLHLTMEALI